MQKVPFENNPPPPKKKVNLGPTHFWSPVGPVFRHEYSPATRLQDYTTVSWPAAVTPPPHSAICRGPDEKKIPPIPELARPRLKSTGFHSPLNSGGSQPFTAVSRRGGLDISTNKASKGQKADISTPYRQQSEVTDQVTDMPSTGNLEALTSSPYGLF